MKYPASLPEVLSIVFRKFVSLKNENVCRTPGKVGLPSPT